MEVIDKDVVRKDLKFINMHLANVLVDKGIKNLRITSLGNSIASGYSMVRTTKPLLLRNEDIEVVMKSFGINLERYNFGRAQNNNDEHIYSWLVQNLKQSEMHRLNRSDYSNSSTSMPTHGLNEKLLEEYYPLELENDKGLQDIIFEKGVDLANIVVYNGGTGSFLDGLSRTGKLSQLVTYGIKRDITSIEATLKYIQEMNRHNNTNVQVYLCGAPNFLGLNISGIINVRLKSLAKKYANVVYVEPVASKFFYQEYSSDLEEKSGVGKLLSYRPDIHYDEDEYLKFNFKILDAISENYSVVQALINVDRDLFKFSGYLETDFALNNPNSKSGYIANGEYVVDDSMVYTSYVDDKNYDYYIRTTIKALLDRYGSDLLDSEREDLIARSWEYLLERKPYDFHYLKKGNIKKVLTKEKESSRR